jgi:hypothetical protein
MLGRQHGAEVCNAERRAYAFQGILSDYDDGHD